MKSRYAVIGKLVPPICILLARVRVSLPEVAQVAARDFIGPRKGELPGRPSLTAAAKPRTAKWRCSNVFNQIVLESQRSLSIGKACLVASYPDSEFPPFSGYWLVARSSC